MTTEHIQQTGKWKSCITVTKYNPSAGWLELSWSSTSYWVVLSTGQFFGMGWRGRVFGKCVRRTNGTKIYNQTAFNFWQLWSTPVSSEVGKTSTNQSLQFNMAALFINTERKLRDWSFVLFLLSLYSCTNRVQCLLVHSYHTVCRYIWCNLQLWNLTSEDHGTHRKVRSALWCPLVFLLPFY